MPAFPGSRMPALTEACAAVRYKQVDWTQQKTQVLVTVLTPAVLGGALCEQTALTAGKIVQEMGAGCLQGGCTFDSIGNLFSVEICATFDGTKIPGSWQELPGIMVHVDGHRLDNVSSFSAWRQVDEQGTALANALWRFRIEELFPTEAAGIWEPEVLSTVAVQRMGLREVYSDCTWISQRLEHTGAKLVRIREGIAAGKTVE